MALIYHDSCGYLLALEESIGAWYTLSVILWCSWLASVKETVKRNCFKLYKLLPCLHRRWARERNRRGEILTAAAIKMEYSCLKRKAYGVLKAENLAHPNSSSNQIFSVQKKFLPLPPSLSPVPLPSSLHNLDLGNGHIGIFPRIQVLRLTAFSGFSNTCTSVLLHTQTSSKKYPHPSEECFCLASCTNSNNKMWFRCLLFTLFA